MATLKFNQKIFNFEKALVADGIERINQTREKILRFD